MFEFFFGRNVGNLAFFFKVSDSTCLLCDGSYVFCLCVYVSIYAISDSQWIRGAGSGNTMGKLGVELGERRRGGLGRWFCVSMASQQMSQLFRFESDIAFYMSSVFVG